MLPRPPKIRPAAIKIGKAKPLFMAAAGRKPHPGASHPHLKRSKLSVAGRSAYPSTAMGSGAAPAFSPGDGGGAPAFPPPGGAPGAPVGAPVGAPTGGDQEQGPADVGGL